MRSARGNRWPSGSNRNRRKLALLVERDGLAQALLIVTAASVGVGEVAATYAGTHEPGTPRLPDLRQSIRTGLLARNAGDGSTRDRGTKNLLLAGMLLGLGAAWLIARYAPSLRTAADSRAAEVTGMIIALAGVGVRSWGIATLGRYFQREVIIEPGQTVITEGPYRWIRHPAYAGNLLTVFGIGLMLGSWVGALAAALIAFVALLPRLRVEERALLEAFGEDYRAYGAETPRLMPGIW
jgi:protein-S-isoprenylcysteine O-methyltransferase Ste14